MIRRRYPLRKLISKIFDVFWPTESSHPDLGKYSFHASFYVHTLHTYWRPWLKEYLENEFLDKLWIYFFLDKHSGSIRADFSLNDYFFLAEGLFRWIYYKTYLFLYPLYFWIRKKLFRNSRFFFINRAWNNISFRLWDCIMLI